MGAKWEQKWAGAIWEQNGSNMGAKWAGARAEAARQPMHPSVMKLQGSVMCQSWQALQQRPEPGACQCKCRYMWCPTSTVCWHRLAKQGSKSRKKQQSVLGRSIRKEENQVGAKWAKVNRRSRGYPSHPPGSPAWGNPGLAHQRRTSSLTEAEKWNGLRGRLPYLPLLQHSLENSQFCQTASGQEKFLLLLIIVLGGTSNEYSSRQRSLLRAAALELIRADGDIFSGVWQDWSTRAVAGLVHKGGLIIFSGVWHKGG